MGFCKAYAGLMIKSGGFFPQAEMSEYSFSQEQRMDICYFLSFQIYTPEFC